VKIQVIETISDPGNPDDDNEDRVGWNETAAFVIDGATPLGPPLLGAAHSDAAWLAEFASDFFLQSLPSAASGKEVVRSLNAAARNHFYSHMQGQAEPYQCPVAAFRSIRIRSNGVETMGFADCVLWIRDRLGHCMTWTGATSEGLPDSRSTNSSHISAPSVGALHDQQVLSQLRMQRSRYNSGAGPWTLGLEPVAADHVVVEDIKIALPALGILCTDGFAAAVDPYRLYTVDSIFAVAEREGLSKILCELRHTEHDLDPSGILFPRFKVSDDATAIFLEIRWS
jgi:hypothetical protein